MVCAVGGAVVVCIVLLSTTQGINSQGINSQGTNSLRYSLPTTSEVSFKVTADCVQATDSNVSSLNIVTGTLNEKIRGGHEESDTGFEGEIPSTDKNTALHSNVQHIQKPTSDYGVTPKGIVTVEQGAPSQIVSTSKSFETNHSKEPTISSAGAGCPNEQGNSSDPSSEQDTSTTDTTSYYSSTTSSETEKTSDITSDQTSYDLLSEDSDTVFRPRSKTKEKNYLSRSRRDARLQNKDSRKQSPSNDITREQSEEEPWPNSDESESKRDADGHESAGSEVKSKRLNSIKKQNTQSDDGANVLSDSEKSILSGDSYSVSEDKFWARLTQETDPATPDSEMVHHHPRPSEGQLNWYAPCHEPPQPEETASSVQVFAGPLRDPATGQFVSPPSCVSVSLQSPFLHRFCIFAIRGTSSGATLRDAISGWVQRRVPNQLRQLIAALVQFVKTWGRGIRSLDAITVQGEGVVNVVESGLVQVASSDWESQLVVLFLLANIAEEFLGLWDTQSLVGHSSDISLLRLFAAWVRNVRNRRVRIVTSPLVDALHQLGEMSLRQRDPFFVANASEEDEN